MHIKIKHIKHTFLIIGCIFLAGFNYLSYVKAEDAATSLDTDKDGLTDSEEKLYGTNASKADTDGDGYSDGIEVKSGYDPAKPAPGDKILATTSSVSGIETTSLTNEVVQELKTFTESKNNESVSTSEVQSLMNNAIAEKTGDPVTWETLPQIDISQLKIKNQSYSNLSESERKIKLREDAGTYFINVAYIFYSNTPNSASTSEELRALGDDFLTHFSSFSTLDPDLEYFADIENRFGLFSDQVLALEVPESLVELHVKLIRLTKGFSSLKDFQMTKNDPASNMIMISKIQNYADLVIDFFGNDFQNYIDKQNE